MNKHSLDKRIADMLLWNKIQYTDKSIFDKDMPQHIKQLIADVIESVTPEKWDEGDGWDVHFGQSDTLGPGGKVIKKGTVRQCCPGDDLAYVRNSTIDTLQANTKALLTPKSPDKGER